MLKQRQRESDIKKKKKGECKCKHMPPCNNVTFHIGYGRKFLTLYNYRLTRFKAVRLKTKNLHDLVESLLRDIR